MATHTALTTLPGRAAAEALAAGMETLKPAPGGIGCFEIEDGSGLWEVGGYFEEAPDPVGLALLAMAHGARPFAVSRLDDRDWVAEVRRELHPIEAGRFTVHGAHDAHRIGPHRLALAIEAAMAFGTGHHGTTRGCLILMDRLARRGWRPARVADIGCGTGVLAMGAARLWRARCLASDIDGVAARTATENARANGLHPWIGVVEAPGLRHPRLRAGAPYDLILANILAAPLKRLAPAIATHLAPGGVAILSGLLSAQAAGVAAVFAGHKMQIAERITLGDWRSLALIRV